MLGFKHTAILSLSHSPSHDVQLPNGTMLGPPCPLLLFATQNCQGHQKQVHNSLEESKETWQLNALWYLDLDPGILKKGH